MNVQSPSPAHEAQPSPKRTLEDKMLRFIEGHNGPIWLAIGLLALVVVLSR